MVLVPSVRRFVSPLLENVSDCLTFEIASADRRPVDPPPIVELRVFEGPNAENDITMTYRANFFLFATLDNARQMSHGRVPQQTQSLPVLTGTPVAGMAYLERPKPAGYFIFPDLSVRHEGKYRLGFSLYEELRDADDMDPETAENAEKAKNPHVSHRLEVKSTPFTVFSAKRFPGLAESTALSKVFAEQGCRVRIRRDVRMRRRGADGKPGRDFEDYDDDHSFERGRVSATPDRYPTQHIGTPHQTPDHMDRPRSSSNTSGSFIHSRRPSNEQMAQQYQQQYSPQTPQGMYPPQTAGGNSWNNAPQQQQMGYMHPPQYNPQQGYQAPQSSGMPPPSYGYAQSYQPHEQGHARNNSVEYPQPPPGPPRSSSTPQPQQNVQPSYPGQHATTYPPSTYGQQPTTQSATAQPSYSTQPPVGSPASYAPPNMLPKIEPSYQPGPIEPARPTNYYEQQQQQMHHVAGNKRPFSSSFDTQALEQPLRKGARPAAVSIEPRYNYGSLETGDEDTLDETAMSYRRADGTQRKRRIPLPTS